MSFVAEKRHEHGMDEDKHRRYQHTADHHFGTEKPPQQDSGFRLGQHRKTEAKAMPTDAGALVHTFKKGTHTEDFRKRLDKVSLADWCI